MNCPKCGAPLKVIKAGVSKSSGKPYSAFYVCPSKCELKGLMDTRVDSKPTPPGWSKPSESSQEMRRDVIVEILTTLDARTKVMLEILQREMPSEDPSY